MVKQKPGTRVLVYGTHLRGIAGTARPLFYLGFLVAVVVLQPVAVRANNQISRSFIYETDMPTGVLVSYRAEGSSSVTLASAANDDYLVGPIVEKGESLVEVRSTTGNVMVATSGIAPVLVSDLGGDIKKGDLLAVSQISGVASKYGQYENVGRIVGVAEEDFRESDANVRRYTLDELGGTEVSVGKISVNINVRDSGQLSGKGISTGALVALGERLAGRSVTLAQVITGMSIFLATVIISTVTLYGGVRGSFTSIGRNPFAAGLVYAGLTRMLLLATLLLIIGSVASYVVLLL